MEMNRAFGLARSAAGEGDDGRVVTGCGNRGERGLLAGHELLQLLPPRPSLRSR